MSGPPKVTLWSLADLTGCSAARLARFVRDEEVGSSNLPIPKQNSRFKQ